MSSVKRAALFIIDMQNDFVLDGGLLKVAQGKSVVPKIKDVLDKFRAKNLPVFHIIRVHRNDGSDVEINRQELFRNHPFAVEGSYGAAVVMNLPLFRGVRHPKGPDECVYRNGVGSHASETSG